MALVNILLRIAFFTTVWSHVSSQLLGLSEGMACGNGGICRRLSSCPVVGNPRVTRPLLCSFVGVELVVCCPPTKTSKAQQMCMMYDQMACTGSGVDALRMRRYAQIEEDAFVEDATSPSVVNPTSLDLINVTISLLSTQGETSTESTTTNNPIDLTSLKPTTVSTLQSKPTTQNSLRLPAITIKPLKSLLSSISQTVGSALPKISALPTKDVKTNTLEDDSARNISSRLPIDLNINNTLAEQKIVGGREARAMELPYMALLGYGTGSAREWACGASIISDQFVMSAAHCADNSILGQARWARVAEVDLAREDSPHQDVAISARYVHPQYKAPAVYNDIALFRLATKLVFSSWVQPICLQVDDRITATKAVAAGWGRTDFVGDTSQRLLKVDISLVEGPKCRDLIGRAGRFLPQGVNTDSMICAGETVGGKDACTGDSGGPLVVGGAARCVRTQIGIISFGRQCALPNMPGIYTKVSKFVPWIESIVWP